jgi:hypothetical protein
VVLTEKEILADTGGGHRGIVTRPEAPLDWAGPIHFLAACHCDEEHGGRPSAIAHGCGASGWLVDDLSE